MAFHHHPVFRPILETALADVGCRLVAHNFLLEERLTEERENRYIASLSIPDVTIPRAMDEWHICHKEYLDNEVYVEQGVTPATFRSANRHNLISGLEEDQSLVRVENLRELRDRARTGDTVNELIDAVERFIVNRSDPNNLSVIEKFLYDCNLYSDGRPTFTGFWGEVKDLFDKDCDDWANRLRDRFGLGSFDPMGGEDIPVLLFRYRISDVLTAYPGERQVAAIPTVLDGALSPFFFPSPFSNDWLTGQVLDLSPGTEETYALRCEILHRFIPYQASFIYRLGSITKSPGKTCEEARRIHLAYLQDDLRYASMLS